MGNKKTRGILTMNKKIYKSNYVRREVQPQAKNPWAHTLAITMQSRNKTTAVGQSKSIIDSTTGEVSNETAIVSIRKKVDRTEFVKLFEGGISNIFELTKPARDIFKAILHLYLNQKMRAEQVYISEAGLEEVGYKRTKPTRISGMNQLINAGFLCEVKGNPYQYWVNPNMFFKGDRMQILQDYVVKGTKAALEQDKEIQAVEQSAKQLVIFHEGES